LRLKSIELLIIFEVIWSPVYRLAKGTNKGNN